MVPPYSSPREVLSPSCDRAMRVKGANTHSTMPTVVITAHWGWKFACISATEA